MFYHIAVSVNNFIYVENFQQQKVTFRFSLCLNIIKNAMYEHLGKLFRISNLEFDNKRLEI